MSFFDPDQMLSVVAMLHVSENRWFRPKVSLVAGIGAYAMFHGPHYSNNILSNK